MDTASPRVAGLARVVRPVGGGPYGTGWLRLRDRCWEHTSRGGTLMFRTIVLAVDGSKYSEKAVELAKRLAMSTNDEVVVTHVTERLPANRPIPASTTRPTGRSSSSPRGTWPSWRRPGSRREPSFAAPCTAARSDPHQPGRGPGGRPDRDGLPRPRRPGPRCCSAASPTRSCTSQRPVLIARGASRRRRGRQPRRRQEWRTWTRHM